MTITLTEQKLDHGSSIPGIEDPGDGGNLRCTWDDSVCTDTVEYRLEYIPRAGETTGEFETYCPRHYVLSLAKMLEDHDRFCNIPIIQHLRSYGPLEKPVVTGF